MNKTSLNISSSISDKLNETSATFRISKKLLVIKIFDYCHRNFDFTTFEYGKLTNYQKKALGDTWKCLRIDFDDTQCDVYFFFKNQYRISLSKLLAVGFVLFFDQIIKELSQNSKKESKHINSLLNSYTRIKEFLWIFVQDSFKYFMIKQQAIP